MDYFFRHYGGVIQVLGIASLGILAALGIDWLTSRMSQDADAFQVLNMFVDLHIQTATPLETQKDDDTCL